LSIEASVKTILNTKRAQIILRDLGIQTYMPNGKARELWDIIEDLQEVLWKEMDLHQCKTCGKMMLHGFGDHLRLCWDCFERKETGRGHIGNMAIYQAYIQGIEEGKKQIK
jgi:hypothetical protein